MGQQEILQLNKLFKLFLRIKVLRNGNVLITEGMQQLGNQEISIEVVDAELLDVAEEFLRFVFDYIKSSNKVIKNNETMNYGYWLVKFKLSNANTLEVWEFDKNAESFVKGGTLTLKYWTQQRRVCEKYRLAFSPPNPEQVTAVMPGVLNGGDVAGVRYVLENHMSGWMLFPKGFDGDVSDSDIEKMERHHTYHVTAFRPELAQFIALPYGARFCFSNNKEEVWFDGTVLE